MTIPQSLPASPSASLTTISLNIKDYALWCESSWHIGDPKNALFVCLAGFAGESGEIAEEILAGNKENLVKEMGDFFYYWLRLNQVMYNPIEVLAVPPTAAPGVLVSDLCLEFHQNVGKVCEYLKKMITADIFDVSTFNNHMQKCFTTFALLAHTQNYTLEEIMRSNREKIESRIQRGTLFGNGNDR